MSSSDNASVDSNSLSDSADTDHESANTKRNFASDNEDQTENPSKRFKLSESEDDRSLSRYSQQENDKDHGEIVPQKEVEDGSDCYSDRDRKKKEIVKTEHSSLETSGSENGDDIKSISKEDIPDAYKDDVKFQHELSEHSSSSSDEDEPQLKVSLVRKTSSKLEVLKRKLSPKKKSNVTKKKNQMKQVEATNHSSDSDEGGRNSKNVSYLS